MTPHTSTAYFLRSLKRFDMENTPITVKQLNIYAKSLIESNDLLANVSVCGEISNFKNHYSSGHWYFTLKDSDAQIRCVMFRSYASQVAFAVSDGMQVILKGRVSIYERDGQYQLYAEEINPLGEGDLSVAFNHLKEKLEKEGLFAPENKRPLKRYPRKIAVLTANTGAAVHDILNITAKRFPICEILLCPVTVQGENAAKSMTDMLEQVYPRNDIDTIIIGRGGGSLEDLWAFNDETLARKIYESPVPVISAVGHETDFTICDFVADVRASTPSHAAELAVPDGSSISAFLADYQRKLASSLSAKYELSRAKYELAISKPPLGNPAGYFDGMALKIDSLTEKLHTYGNSVISAYERRLSDSAARLDALSPLKTIARGYAAVTSDGKRIKGVLDLEDDMDISLRFIDGDADCKVTAIRSKQ